MARKPRKSYTTAEYNYLRDHYSEATAAACAAHLGRTVGSLKGFIRDHPELQKRARTSTPPPPTAMLEDTEPEDTPADLERKANHLAAAVLREHPQCWPKRRTWAGEKVATMVLIRLQDDEPDPRLAKAEAARWLQDSWAKVA